MTEAPKREYWAAPEIWADDVVYIIGGGPSLLGMDLSPIHHRPVLGVNNAYMLGPWVDVTFFGDKLWWEQNYRKLLRYPSLIVTNNNWDYFSKIDRVKQMKRSPRAGLNWRSKDTLCWNDNSGGAAINLAFHFGASKIVLLGFDMKVDKEKGLRGGHNWHGEHKNRTPEDFIYAQRFLPTMKRIKADLHMLNLNGSCIRHVEILNATPGSALDYFPMVNFEDTL